VLSARNALMLAGIPVGGLLAGVLLDVAGLTGTILVIGLLTATVATVAAVLPALRQLDELPPPRQGPDGPDGAPPATVVPGADSSAADGSVTDGSAAADQDAPRRDTAVPA
jgi:hypothetical protein